MKLLVQPGEGTTSLIRGINSAQKTVEIVIFRFDRREIERALKDAVERGVFVHALVAHTNRGGEKKLRKLEMRLLAAGVSVARTDDDLVRYHDKLLIIDRRLLYLLGFNLTYLDIERSRSFGIVTKDRKLVQEAVRLFEADTKRQEYKPEYERFVVSPVNARKQLAGFIKGAKKSLLIYDLNISDAEMIRLLQGRAKAGVEIRIIGRVTRKGITFEVRRLASLRLHTRTLIRDGKIAFIGSQSLRALELDVRREVGAIFRDAKVINTLIKIFEDDWKSGQLEKEQPKEAIKDGQDIPVVGKARKSVAKAVIGELSSVSDTLEETLKRTVRQEASVKVDSTTVEQAVKSAVKQAVRDVMEQGVDQKALGKA